MVPLEMRRNTETYFWKNKKRKSFAQKRQPPAFLQGQGCDMQCKYVSYVCNGKKSALL